MKKEYKCFILFGVFCFFILMISLWYSVTFNDSRLVSPMNFENYVFRTEDLPMLISTFAVCLYVIILFGFLIVNAVKNRRKYEQAKITRKINPKLGFLGFLGFLGLGGFWTYNIDGSVFPFVFFLFFGFFGFYYEGKMSGTFMDERFRENAARAQLRASNISFSIIFIALIIFCQGKLSENLEYTLIAVIITLSLALALRIFLSEYFLYRYDYCEQADKSEE